MMCLAPGVTIASAQAGLDRITRRLDEQDPSAPVRADKGRRVTLLPAGTMMPIPRNLRPVVAGFFVVLMGLIMAIACMNLGVRKGQVLRLVLREGAALISIGTVLGFLGAFVMAKILSALTKDFADAFRFGTNDPRLLVGAPLLLAALAMLACYVPARRSTKIDPLTALRQE